MLLLNFTNLICFYQILLTLYAFTKLKKKVEFLHFLGKDCNDLSPIIPIVVGAVLGVLVLIVIVAYLIGRRRSRSGYEEI